MTAQPVVATPAPPAKPVSEARPGERKSLPVLCLLALGIVYGDIGTSPLYAFKVAVTAAAGSGAPATAAVLGILSLIVWSLIVIVSIKYVVFVMRADNHGEGGILALLALVHPWSCAAQSRRSGLILLGIFGAALLYGDGVITPAISVMSAVEGLEVAAPALAPYVKPLTVAILVGLFLVQSKGTARIGRLFGPVMAVWFLAIALLGVVSIAHTPGVLAALNPQYAFGVFFGGGWTPFFVFGAVFLALTGGEALYADMGHVGRFPIRVAWTAFVLPALVLNYAGQAALMLRECVRLAREEQRLVVFLEPIALYPMRDLNAAGDGEWMDRYPAPGERLALGTVGVHGRGTDLAIVTFGNGVYLSRQAQATLAAAGIKARVIDLRWLSPLPATALVEALAGCKAALIVDETRASGGVAEALMALLHERTALPHARLTAQDSFIATGPAYAATMPSAAAIVAAAEALLEAGA